MDINEALAKIQEAPRNWIRKKTYEERTYVLSAASLEAADKWHKKHLKENKVCRDKQAGVDYVFSHGSGIGVSTDVRCHRCKEEHDITDFSNW
jgi:hypothetical protein